MQGEGALPSYRTQVLRVAAGEAAGGSELSWFIPEVERTVVVTQPSFPKNEGPIVNKGNKG